MAHLKSLSVKKSPGPDRLTNELLSNCSEALAEPLAFIIHLTLSTGVLPQDWKLANVVPLPKSGCPSLVVNYRPISLTSSVCKLAEKVVSTRLKNFLDPYSVLSLHQYGFRALKLN